MILSSPRLEIVGTGSYVPEEVIPNSYFEGRDLFNYDALGNRIGGSVRLTDEKILKQTGIRERRRSKPDEWPSDMGYIAALRALENADVSANSLVGIILASVTERCNFPSGACKLQEKLGARNVCVAYDMQSACAGFPEALMDADARALRIPGNYLVVASEALTKIVGFDDVNSDLFGDGAGAVVLKPTNEERGIAAGYAKSEPFDGKLEYIIRDPADFLRMPEGPNVLKAAVRSMIEAGNSLKRDLGWEKVRLIIPHQANSRIVGGVAERIGAKIVTDVSEIDRYDGTLVFQNVARYGNISAVTCPLALDECRRSGIIKKGDRVEIISFGSGIVTSGVAVQF